MKYSIPCLNTLLILSLTFILTSCTELKSPSGVFPFFLNEKCMILNQEMDNTIEGTYLKIQSGKDSVSFEINLPPKFYVNNSNCKNWMIGWGNKIPLYDAGNENLREIESIDLTSGTIKTGKLLRGQGFPEQGQRVVFWNRNPSGFSKENTFPVINTKVWPDFHGESAGFGDIIFDSLSGKWIMFINEVDTDFVQTYAAESSNLVDWNPSNNGKALFTTSVTSVIHSADNKWYFFTGGKDSNGKQQIGLAVSEKSIFGPYAVFPRPVLLPGGKGSWTLQEAGREAAADALIRLNRAFP